MASTAVEFGEECQIKGLIQKTAAGPGAIEPNSRGAGTVSRTGTKIESIGARDDRRARCAGADGRGSSLHRSGASLPQRGSEHA